MARIVIALGGNALGNNPNEQYHKINEACPALVELINQGHEIIISHGNGPQVGMINLAFDVASDRDDKICPMDLPECTAMSQGYIGYHLQQCLKTELNRNKLPWNVATVVTQVIVDYNDPAFHKPTKPIGPFYSEEKVNQLQRENPDLQFIEDSGRGYRRVVASPRPKYIAEKESILNLLDHEYIVIACGGGGIPVYEESEGEYTGIPAVIDKDFASAKLAENIQADYLFILTEVEYVYVNFGKSNQQALKHLSVENAERYIQEGQFGKGSMLPKVQAAIEFVRSGNNKKAVIGALTHAGLAMKGESGTLITIE